MARIALIKIFTGLNLAPAQLSAELQRVGHDSRIIYFKNHQIVPQEEMDQWAVTDHPGYLLDPNGRTMVWNCYKDFNKRDMALLVEELKQYRPDAIGFSLVSGIIRESAFVTRHLRQHFDVPFIWGGPGPSLEPERCMQYADLVCTNEGEEVIIDLADRLDAGAPLNDIAGTWARDSEGSVVKNPDRPLLNLDDIAIPNWNLEHYVHINTLKGARPGIYPPNLGEEYPIMTQRGCPFSCSFCIESRYQEMFGKKNSLRRRSVDLVLEELHQAKETLPFIKSVLFYDDVFTVNPRWLREFLPRYKKEIGLPFWCYTYPTTHTPELLSELKDAGLVSITMGIQSGSARILKEHFNRPTDTRRVLEAAQEIVDLGPEVTGFFDLISEVPFETEEDLRATFNFLLELPVEMKTMGIGMMTNFPTYDFTRQVENNPGVIARHDQNLPQEVYDYYHKLYLLTRSNIPRDTIRQLGEDPKYRNNPQLLDEWINNDEFMTFTGISF